MPRTLPYELIATGSGRGAGSRRDGCDRRELPHGSISLCPRRGVRDTRAYLRAAAGLQPFDGPVGLVVAVDDAYCESRLLGRGVTSTEQRLTASVILVF